MANREIFPGGDLSPLAGDIENVVGNTIATVIGIQNTPVDFSFPNGGEVLQYNPLTGTFQFTLSACIQINSFYCSNDYNISFNLNPSQISVNGSPI
jgi:hypothetical protein